VEVIYGFNPIEEALKAQKRKFFEILVARESHDKISTLAKGVSLSTVTRHELDRITGVKNHQGIAARVSPFRYATVEDAAALDFAILLDSVEDPQNLGSIIRTAYALAGAAVIIPEDRAASVTPAVVKASAGATEKAVVAKVVNLRHAIKELKKNGFWLVGLDARAKESIAAIPDFKKTAIIMGGEDSGIRPVIVGELDFLAHIPMKGPFNSLNVSQSAAIAVYELAVRRNHTF
jgi:23S rRNA (guanosine2251-2'-O)-methyltransferase